MYVINCGSGLCYTEHETVYFLLYNRRRHISDHNAVNVFLDMSQFVSQRDSQKQMFLNFDDADDAIVLHCLEQSYDEFLFLYLPYANVYVLRNLVLSLAVLKLGNSVERCIPKHVKNR